MSTVRAARVNERAGMRAPMNAIGTPMSRSFNVPCSAESFPVDQTKLGLATTQTSQLTSFGMAFLQRSAFEVPRLCLD